MCDDAVVSEVSSGPLRPPTGPVGTVRRAAEQELDVVVAHELASGGPAATMLWRACGFDVPEGPVAVVRQYARDDGRTTDVYAAADTGVLHCENKAAGGQFEEGQPESYAAHVKRHPGSEAVLVAPRSFLQTLDATAWSGHVVAVEDLAAALRIEADRRGVDDELGRSYRWRAATLGAYAASGGYRLVVDAERAAFADWYRALAREVSGGRIALHPGTMQAKGATFAEYLLAPFPSGDITLTHKVTFGYVDLWAGRWTLRRLKGWVDGLPDEAKPPSGWEVVWPAGARTSRRTGERVPVLRWHVPAVTLPAVPSPELEPALAEIVRLTAAIKGWLDAGAGSVLASGGGRAAVDRELRCAHTAARLVGDEREAAIVGLIGEEPGA
jgi:hypothetical protein